MSFSTISGGLPRTAGWAQKLPLGSSTVSSSTSQSSSGLRDRTRRGHRSTRSGTGEGRDSRTQTGSARQPPNDRERDRKPVPSTKTSSQASSSRPPTPAAASIPQRPSTPARQKAKKDSQAFPSVPAPPRSPTSSVAVDSDIGSQDAVLASPAMSPPSVEAAPVTPAVPPGLPTAPPGLPPAPVGINAPAIAPSVSYQMSTQVQALLDDVRNRRESLIHKPSTSYSPFPDLDKTLQNLSGADGDQGGFNFNLDPKLAVDDDQLEASLLELEDRSSGLTLGAPSTYPAFDPFSNAPRLAHQNGIATPFGPPPGLFPAGSNRPFVPPLDRTPSNSSTYTGSFKPFMEDDDRRVSRMEFARPMNGISATSSPRMSVTSSVGESQPQSAASSHAPWQFPRHLDVGPPPGLPIRAATPGSHKASPLAPFANAMPQTSFIPQPTRFQPFDMGQSDMSLKDMLGIGKGAHNTANRAYVQANGRRILLV